MFNRVIFEGKLDSGLVGISFYFYLVVIYAKKMFMKDVMYYLYI